MRLPTNSPARVSALDCLNGHPTVRHSGQVRQMAHLAADPTGFWQERQVACWVLGQWKMDREQKEIAAFALADVLQDCLPEDTRDEREASCQRLALTGAILALPTFGVTLLLNGWAVWRAWQIDQEDRRVNRLRVAAAESLENLAAPLALGVLARALNDWHLPLRPVAKRALCRTLDAVTEEDYGVLTPPDVLDICRLLAAGDDALALRTVMALEHIGTGRTVPFVKAASERGKTSRLRTESARVLPVLQERLRLETDRYMLLRGATSPNYDPMLLVRPTRGIENESLLLRPVEARQDGDTSTMLRSYPVLKAEESPAQRVSVEEENVSNAGEIITKKGR